MKSVQILWSQDALDSLDEILEYIAMKSGEPMAQKICSKIIAKIDLLAALPLQRKIVSELKEIGIRSVHEIVEAPWRILYRIQENTVYILSVLDGRRNIQELLISKVMDSKM